jgi:hypothetical protein
MAKRGRKKTVPARRRAVQVNFRISPEELESVQAVAGDLAVAAISRDSLLGLTRFLGECVERDDRLIERYDRWAREAAARAKQAGISETDRRRAVREAELEQARSRIRKDRRDSLLRGLGEGFDHLLRFIHARHSEAFRHAEMSERHAITGTTVENLGEIEDGNRAGEALEENATLEKVDGSYRFIVPPHEPPAEGDFVTGADGRRVWVAKKKEVL